MNKVQNFFKNRWDDVKNHPKTYGISLGAAGVIALAGIALVGLSLANVDLSSVTSLADRVVDGGGALVDSHLLEIGAATTVIGIVGGGAAIVTTRLIQKKLKKDPEGESSSSNSGTGPEPEETGTPPQKPYSYNWTSAESNQKTPVVNTQNPPPPEDTRDLMNTINMEPSPSTYKSKIEAEFSYMDTYMEANESQGQQDINLEETEGLDFLNLLTGNE